MVGNSQQVIGVWQLPIGYERYAAAPLETERTSRMNIVTFASTKGGVGKSTSAAIFVDSLIRSGQTVRALDFDDQGNFRKWVTGVAPRFPNLTFSEIEGRKDAGFLHYYNALVELFEDETDWVVMDTKGTDDPRQPAALAISDIVIAPSGPIENELAGVSKITEYLRLALKQSDPDVDPLDILRVLYRQPAGFVDRMMTIQREVLFEHFGVISEIHYSGALGSFLGHRKSTDEVIADMKEQKLSITPLHRVQEAADRLVANIKEATE